MISPQPLKSLGQNFLRRRRFLVKIAEAVGPQEVILEIGAGQGDLTEFLLPQAKKILAVEIDKRLFEILKKKFGRNPRLELYNEDILKFDFSRQAGEVTAVGNIPYYLSNDLVHCLVGQRRYVRQAFLTFQYEFGLKLLPQGKKRSFLAFFLQYYAQAKPLFVIPPSAFYPRPRVKSLFMQIDFRRPHGRQCFCEDFLWRVLKTAFLQRRKKIANSLKALAGALDIKEAVSRAGVSYDARPESLSLDDFIRISEILCRAQLPGF